MLRSMLSPLLLFRDLPFLLGVRSPYIYGGLRGSDDEDLLLDIACWNMKEGMRCCKVEERGAKEAISFFHFSLRWRERVDSIR